MSNFNVFGVLPCMSQKMREEISRLWVAFSSLGGPWQLPTCPTLKNKKVDDVAKHFDGDDGGSANLSFAIEPFVNDKDFLNLFSSALGKTIKVDFLITKGIVS